MIVDTNMDTDTDTDIDTDTNFNFNSVVDDKFVYTGSKSFTLANGSNLADSNITLFQF